ncbi:hypothetical protein ACFVH7_42655 [Kitasatospora indigofera]|uniref:hypothetical protein n=1 Tax=Kitasatospora indigofera TaxID=67307 RepID=UPI0036406EF4
MSNTVLADSDIVSDFMAVFVRHGHLHSAEPADSGGWSVRRTSSTRPTTLTSEQIEELVMDHLITAFAARGLAADLDL